MDSNQSDQHGRTPLSVAVPSWPSVVRCLLEAGAATSGDGPNGGTEEKHRKNQVEPLTLAVFFGAFARFYRAFGRRCVSNARSDKIPFLNHTSAVLEDNRTRQYLFFGEGKRIYHGRIYPAHSLHWSLFRARNLLDGSCSSCHDFDSTWL